MKKSQLNNSINNGYGTIPEVEMEGEQKEVHEPGANPSVLAYRMFPRFYFSRAFSSLFIYALTHTELATLPFLPALAYLKKQKEKLKSGHLLNRDENEEGYEHSHEAIANILSKAALHPDLVSLLEGAGHFTEKFFPAALLGLLLHDVISYYMQVDNRYGTTLKTHLLGTASNTLAWSSMYGTDMVLETLHWLIPTTVGLAVTGSALSQLIYDRYRINASKTTNAAIDTETSLRCLRHIILWNGDNRHQALKRLGELSHIAGSRWQRFRALSMLEQAASSFQPNPQHDGNTESLYGAALHLLNQRADNPDDSYLKNYARYLCWSLGEAPSNKANLWLLPFAFISLFILAAKLRLVEMWWRKAKELYDYRDAKQSCEQESNVYTLTQSGNVECTVCGDWPNMYYGDVLTTQACLTGLLAKTQKPSLLLNQLTSIQERLNRYADIRVIDLSKQDLATAWSEAEWDRLLTFLEAIPHLHLSAFNLSTSTISPLSLSDQKMQRLAKFMKQVPIECFDVSGQPLSKDFFDVVSEGIRKNTALTNLRFSNTSSGDAAACQLAALLPVTKITTLMTGYNNVSDAGIGCYTQVLPMTQIKNFFAPGNPMTEDGMLPFVQNLHKTKIRHLDISAIKLSSPIADALGQQLAFLYSLYLAKCQLSDKHISNWPTYVSNATTKVYDLSDNNLLTGISIVPFLAAQPTNHRLAINLAGLLRLNSYDYQQIGRLLTFKKITSLDISRTYAKCVGIVSLMANSSQLHTLIAADNDIIDACMPAFSQSIVDKSNLLQYLDLANNAISSSGASQLLARVSSTQLRVLNLAGNQLTGSEFSDYPQAIANSKLIELNLAQNPILNKWLSSLLDALLINTSLQKLDLSNIALTQIHGLLLAQHLLPSIPHPDSLSDATLTRDQQRWLHDIQTSNESETHISELRLSNTQLGEKGIRALCHAAPVAHLVMLELSGNGVDATIETIHDCRTIVMPPSSMVIHPFGTFTKATSYHAASLVPTVFLAGTLLAWSVKKLLSNWTRNSCPKVEATNTETLVTDSSHPSR